MLVERSRWNAALGCADLLEHNRQPDDGDIVVAQRVSVPVPLPPGQSPLLAQLPQERYLFLAEAHDRFGLTVARGSTARRRWRCERATTSMPTAPSTRWWSRTIRRSVRSCCPEMAATGSPLRPHGS